MPWKAVDLNAQKEQCPDPFKDKVKCDTCKCWVDKRDAHEVIVISRWGESARFYCQAHRPAYKKMFVYDSGIEYIADVEVNKDGIPVGYKKIDKSK